MIIEAIGGIVGGLLGLGDDKGKEENAVSVAGPKGGHAGAADNQDAKMSNHADQVEAKTKKSGGGGLLGGIFNIFKGVAQKVAGFAAGIFGFGDLYKKAQDVWRNPTAQNLGELIIEGGEKGLPLMLSY
ncbi:hypothetical protein CS022_03465 [Veronia nyctiphanis]|uniref:Uncharacterized protein n=1 Tax=Veronia nyctiphanis TaxID=1278244 RepID=A0A4Q0YUX4_9GAMM|nr:hypothetical protein [Veronia nyctiphanis]RXJ74633.1 hypothetical protein CS022_03465 [Veronia nyctiphanis]